MVIIKPPNVCDTVHGIGINSFMPIEKICPLFLFIQKYEEQSNNNCPVSIADVENKTVVKLVDAGVTAMMTRLQSKLYAWL